MAGDKPKAHNASMTVSWPHSLRSPCWITLTVVGHKQVKSAKKSCRIMLKVLISESQHVEQCHPLSGLGMLSFPTHCHNDSA